VNAVVFREDGSKITPLDIAEITQNKEVLSCSPIVVTSGVVVLVNSYCTFVVFVVFYKMIQLVEDAGGLRYEQCAGSTKCSEPPPPREHAEL